MKIFVALCMLLLSLSSESKNSSLSTSENSNCLSCEKILNYAKEYKIESEKEKPNYNKIQIKASLYIMELFKKNPKLNAEQIKAYVQLLSTDTPVDPGRDFIANTFDAIAKNRTEIEVEIKKLPKEEAKDLLEAIEISFSDDDNTHEH
jgi:hypothetical protein